MSARPMRVMLVRHPETEANLVGRYIGRNHSPVTDRGRLQMRWLARAVAEWNPETVLSSPLERTLDAARAVVPAGVPLRVLDDLVEIDFGDAEGYTYAELQERGLELDYTGSGPIAPGGETVAEFEARVVRAAEEIERSGMRVMVMTHGGVLRRLVTHWLDLSVGSGWSLAFPNAAIAVLRFTDEMRVLESLTPPPGFDEQSPGRRAWHL
ncbi:MAG: histidine phosphatase family protein [Coriobacteriia bacterium]|nr:histidine phosphatase family protein [Coriobacteriia bacterium]